MRPDVVTFWHGPLDRLRQTCLRSQVAAGHHVTVYSFEPLAGVPDGVGHAEAEAVLSHGFAERLRPTRPDGAWRDWTTLQFSDFFRMRLMAQRAGLWLDANVLLLKPVEIDPAKPYFAWAPPRRRAAQRPAEELVLCGSCRPRTVLRALGFFSCHRRSRHHRAAHLPKGPRQSAAYCRKPVCLGRGEIWLLGTRRNGSSSPLPLRARVARIVRCETRRKKQGARNQCPIAAIASAIAMVRLAISACSR